MCEANMMTYRGGKADTVTIKKSKPYTIRMCFKRMLKQYGTVLEVAGISIALLCHTLNCRKYCSPGKGHQ